MPATFLTTSATQVVEPSERIGKRHRKGWSGSSNAGRTRKSPARESRPPRRYKAAVHMQSKNLNPVTHKITDAFAPLRMGVL